MYIYIYTTCYTKRQDNVAEAAAAAKAKLTRSCVPRPQKSTHIPGEQRFGKDVQLRYVTQTAHQLIPNCTMSISAGNACTRSTISHCVGEGKDLRTRLTQVEQAKRTAGASRTLAFIAVANGPIRIENRFSLYASIRINQTPPTAGLVVSS
ncbi:hypothetical protein T4B_14337 [Trichinella pseudospiralis]|uniref:Uncharacterized protein n=2 Tax=Trichinella pseudospiralis TaxID=6337 RepID=A0A0V1EFR7_TRIPS|nr:hypothetical protein T4A_4250 [Trichinella pseudospiralis]KRZ28033.1 hypothetical protein T4B_14337 [Trichinella pseudospiralis]KRZ33681.1 hypothetical protein T4C_4983 [Trichinella pseudospiralis]